MNVYAGSLSVWASANTIVVGDSISVSVASKGIFCKYNIKVSDSSILSGPASGNVDDGETSVYTFTAKSAGSVTITIVPTDGADYDNNGVYTQSKSVSINVVNKSSGSQSSNNSNSSSSRKNNGETTAEKKEYDSNNDLKSLSVDGYELNPSFTKDVLEYKLDVDESVEKINIKATASSDKATVHGVGDVNLTSGENTINVKVEAENGNEKIYKILVTVKDQHPIKVMADGKEFTVVKKNNDIIKKLEYYEEEVIKIDDQDVVSYYNSKTKVRLVILKSDDNKVDYYIYNDRNKKYSKYRAITVGGITLQLLDVPKKLLYFKKYSTTITDMEVDIYKIKKSHHVGLLYGTNVKNGNTGYYVFDSDEDTLSRYYDEEVKLINGRYLDFKNQAMIFIGVVSGIALISLVINIIQTIKRRSRRKIN